MFPIRDTIPAARFPLVMVLLIAANVWIFLHELTLGEGEIHALISTYGIVPARDWLGPSGFARDPGRVLPFFTTMFLHGGLLHLISNMWSLWLFGDNVEDRMGRLKFFVFYVLCGLAAGLAHSALSPESTVPAIGASGAIAGVMGAYMILFPGSRLLMFTVLIFYPVFFELPALVFLIFWFLGQFLSGSYMLGIGADAGGIAFWAHIGGFLAGIGLLPFFVRRRS